MRTIFTLLAVSVSYITFSQNTVYFPGFEMINVEGSEGLQYSVSKLIKAYIEDNHDFTIILEPSIGSTGYDVKRVLPNSSKKALELNARYVMQGEIHFLEGVYIVALGVYESRSNERVWHDMAKGVVEQDLDALLSRLGRSFLTNKTAKADINIDEVTEYDQQGVELAQIKVNQFFGVMLGGKYVPNETVLSGIGIAYTYDASTVLFNFDFELYPSSNLLSSTNSETRKIQNGTINLGVTYPFTRKRSTVYINGGMEYGYTRAGIGAFVGAGVLINRNSTVNLRLFTALSMPFYEADYTNLTGIKFGIVTSFAR